MSSRPASSSSRAKNADENSSIDKLDYKPGGRPLIHDHSNDASEPASRQSEERSHAGSFFNEVAEGIVEQDRAKMNKEVVRYFSFVWAIINCLGAGGITAFSLYGPLFQRRLHYSQLQVNGVSIAAELALYLPVPLWGLMCDRYGPGWPSLLSGIFFGLGYLLAAFAYKSGPPPVAGGDGWPYWVMILAFVAIGTSTSCMYLSAVTTCAKNFGRGKNKGIALALPIGCFGLSGMWQSQVGSQILYEKKPDGSKGDVDVHRYFLFLAIYLLVTGIIGFFALRVVGEEELIDEAVDELEQSGLLDGSEFFQRMTSSGHIGYGTITANGERRLSDGEVDELRRRAEEEKQRREEEQRKKTWLLNEETRRFLADRTMWWLAAGFFLVTGPGEAFINNLGTIIGTLYPPSNEPPENSGITQTSAATHVSIVAITSTVARILTGTVTDLLAPSSDAHQHRRGPTSLVNSLASLPGAAPESSGRFEFSRIIFLIAFSIIMSIGQIILASGALQGHGNLFWLVSASIGAGYGAVFSLTPICCSVIWGVENFGTNWGIVATVPAIGATVWGLVYSGVYQWASERGPEASSSEDVLCYGALCYAPTFGAMAVSVWVACGFWLWAWKGPDGWFRRGIAV